MAFVKITRTVSLKNLKKETRKHDIIKKLSKIAERKLGLHGNFWRSTSWYFDL